MNAINVPIDVMDLILPKGTMDWFEITKGTGNKKEINIILEEKNIPPLPSWYNNEKVKSKGFKEITISDFPIRGRTTTLTFRRRSWEIEGYSKRLKREIKLNAPGTLLEEEFASFLKE